MSVPSAHYGQHWSNDIDYKSRLPACSKLTGEKKRKNTESDQTGNKKYVFSRWYPATCRYRCDTLSMSWYYIRSTCLKPPSCWQRRWNLIGLHRDRILFCISCLNKGMFLTPYIFLSLSTRFTRIWVMCTSWSNGLAANRYSSNFHQKIRFGSLNFFGAMHLRGNAV